MMSLWDALRMNMMISYQELVRTFLSSNIKSKMAEIYGCPSELLICPSWMTAEHK
ncbi:GhoT/OrtT family toxin [Escherichia coli]